MAEPRFDPARILACPKCRGSLEKAARSWDCASCGARWPVLRGIPRFVDSEHYVGSFGWEWRRHRRTQIDLVRSRSRESEETFAEKTGLAPSDVKGKVVLDVGVGSGRFSHVVARWGGIPVGVDLSLAVLTARENLGPFYPDALVVQGDAFALPFREESFDHVFSIGVLHHTPSTREAFRRVVRFAKPGATVALAVYDAAGIPHFKYARRYRRWTTRLPHPLLHFLSHAAIPVHHLVHANRGSPAARHLSDALARVLATAFHEDPLWRVLDTFDWYAPRYQWLHDETEVKRWFTDLGFENVRRLPERTMVSVRGTRPLALATPPAGEEKRWGEVDPLPSWLPGHDGSLRSGLLSLLLAAEVGRAGAEELGELLRFGLDRTRARLGSGKPAASPS